jgi:AcrR family transcriptional regulator
MTTQRKIPVHFDAAQATKKLTKKETSRDRQTQQRIEEIVEVAVELFAREGMANFSMRRIAALAGITLSTLQHHFGNQKNLLIITINSIGSGYMRRLQSIGTDTKIPAQQRFDRTIDQVISWALDPVLVAAYLELFTLARKDNDIAELLDEIYSIYYGVLADLVGEINPRLSAARARIVGILIGTQADGLMFFNRHGASTEAPLAHVVSAMKAAWMEEIAKSESERIGLDSERPASKETKSRSDRSGNAARRTRGNISR